MDTREKIVDLARAADIAANLRNSGVKWKLMTGYFDVLTPDHIRGVQSLANGKPLMAVVLDPPDPLLSPRARAELAASLRVVDYVVLPGRSGADQVLRDLRPDEVIRTETADQRRSQALIEHVHRRSRA